MALLCAFPLFAAENVKSIDGVPIANIKSVDGVAIANVKSVDGVDNTASGGGGGAGPFTFVNHVAGGNGGSGIQTVSATAALNLQAGDLVVAVTTWQTAAASDTVTVDENDGTDAFTAGPEDSANNDTGTAINYILNAPADASFTPRTTISASGKRRITLNVYQYRPTSGTATVDGAPPAAVNGTGVLITTGQVTTSVADTVIVAGGVAAAGASPSAEQIGGVAADRADDAAIGFGGIWYRILTATVSNAAGTATVGNDLWGGAIIAFK